LIFKERGDESVFFEILFADLSGRLRRKRLGAIAARLSR